MLYRVKPGQVSYGEAVGIILLENYVPFIPGDVANATSYDFPVRFQRVEGFTAERIFRHDMSLTDDILRAAQALEREGVRAITGDCGFMILYQDALMQAVSVPVFMSSLLQIPFMRNLLPPGGKIGIVTANSESLNEEILSRIGGKDCSDLSIAGMETSEYFYKAVFLEEGELDSERIEQEVVSRALHLVKEDPAVRLILLECSLMPPYGRAVYEAVGLPVFDYITMINYVYSTVVKRRFSGEM
ncbi:MAG: aspartate/glutamate racemase family protein [Spirochaetales bacterium]|nr:aspartate/glutamate racemase family protein [Spirochaetales bacterium]